MGKAMPGTDSVAVPKNLLAKVIRASVTKWVICLLGFAVCLAVGSVMGWVR